MPFFAFENINTRHYEAFSIDIRRPPLVCDCTSHRAVLLLQKEVTDSCQLTWYVANNSSILCYCHGVSIEGIVFFDLAAEFFSDGGAPVRLVHVVFSHSVFYPTSDAAA